MSQRHTCTIVRTQYTESCTIDTITSGDSSSGEPAFLFAIQKKGVYMTRKKMLLFTLVISMGTVWRLLELLEYGEIEVRQVDTYMYFYMLATCFVAFLVGKESATIKAAKEQKMLQGSMPEQQNQTTKKQ